MRFFCSLLMLALLLASLSMVGQSRSAGILISIQNEAGEALPNVYLRTERTSGFTNEMGNWRASRPVDSLRVAASFIGYRDTVLWLSPAAPARIVLPLQRRNELLTEVEVVSEHNRKARQILQNEVLRLQVSPRDIHSTNNLLGEPEITRPLLYTPGVQPGVGNSADLYVRGSETYQNGLFLDGYRLLSLRHGFGYFSSVPVGAVNGFQFHRQAYPLRYGHATASILDVQVERGSTEKIDGAFGLSPLALQGKLSVPVVKGKSALMLNGRFSTAGPIFDLLERFTASLDYAFGYNDGLAKYHHRLNAANTLEALYFRTEDWATKLNFPSPGAEARLQRPIRTVHQLAGLKWLHQGADWYGETKIFGSQYTNQFKVHPLEGGQVNELNAGTVFSSALRSDLNRLGASSRWQRSSHRGYLELGGGLNYLEQHWARYEAESRDTTRIIPARTQHLWNAHLFAEAERALSSELKLQGGVRLETYAGPQYPLDFKILPRLNVQYTPLKNWAFFLSYDRAANALIRARADLYGNLLDIPTLAQRRLPVSVTDQVSTGAVWSWQNLQLQGLLFYRAYQNVPARNYAERFTSLLQNNNLQLTPRNSENYHPVDGHSYGAEFRVKYAWQNLDLSASYTYTESERQGPGINQGRTYPFAFNHRHAINTKIKARFENKDIKKVTEIVLGYRYGSGKRTTFPFQELNFGNNFRYNVLDSRNNALLPPAHLLNLSFNFISKRKDHLRTFSISISQVTLAPYIFNYTSVNPKNGKIRGESPLPLFPSISYYIDF